MEPYYDMCPPLKIVVVKIPRNDEIAFLKPSNFMRPPIDGYSLIFRKYHGIVVFFNNCRNLVPEFQRRDGAASTIMWAS